MTRSVIAILIVTAVTVAGCGSGGDSERSTASPAPGATTSDPVDGQPAVPTQLQFSATTIDGEPFSGESLAGKPAVLWFWAPWCPVCQREAPAVAQVAGAFPEVTFVGVAGLADVPAMKEFVDRYPVERFTQLADTDGAVWTKFGVTQQPAFAFVSADGSVDVVRGDISEPDLTVRTTSLIPR